LGNVANVAKGWQGGKHGNCGQGGKTQQRQATWAIWVRQIMLDTRQKGTESPKAEGKRSGVTWREETPKREDQVATSGTTVATRNEK
jgi:hypothetical protein